MDEPGKVELKKSILAIEKIEDPMARAEALATEAENINPDSPLIGEVFQLVLDTDPSFGARNRAYQALLPKLTPDLLQHALSMVEKHENEKLQAEEDHET